MRTDRRNFIKSCANFGLYGSLGSVLPVAGLLPKAVSAQARGMNDQSQTTNFFRIGTASVGGTYFPVAGLVASAISNPPGSRPCSRGGSCGVPGLIAVAVSTEGSVFNVEAIASGALESGFAQADIAHWAWKGSGVFDRQAPLQNLRTIANLYPEAIQVVVREESGIESIADLKGKKIGVGPEGSGTYVDALLILDAFGVGPQDLELSTERVDIIIEKVRLGELDGLVMVAGTPTPVIADLARQTPIKLIPLNGREIDRLIETTPFFTTTYIPANTYSGTGELITLSVGAQWLTSAEMDDTLIYEITRALWNPNTLNLLSSGHQKGGYISLSTAVQGIGVPFHPGAFRYYEESGVIMADHIQALQDQLEKAE